LEAISAFTSALAIYEEAMRASQMARYYKEIAEIYEQENEIAHAIEYYRKVSLVLAYDEVLYHFILCRQQMQMKQIIRNKVQINV
jgi:alpha-soluble NSF attachment protein